MKQRDLKKSPDNARMKRYAIRIGARMQHARLASELTQKVAAKELGVSPVTLSNIERGVHLTSLSTVYRMAQVYNETLAWFLDSDPLPKLNRQRGPWGQLHPPEPLVGK